MATTSLTKPASSFWSKWWPYIIIFILLAIFPLIAGLTMGDPAVVDEAAGPVENILNRAGSGYAKFWQGMLIQMFILGIFAMSYDLLLGYAGVLSFGHAMFFGTGG